MSNSRLSGSVSQTQMVGLMLLAYAFSFAIRMIWVWQFQDNPNFYWNDELMINTNDGYFFAAGVQQAIDGLHENNPRVFGLWDYGVIFFTTLFAKITPFSLETIILYMPSIISSLVVIPMILIARLYNQTLWGFFAALLGSITWSYYNRTMTGYYDTDMFSAMAPMVILFFLLKSTHDFHLRSALYAGIAIILYPFLYDQGQAIVYAIGIIYGFYMVWAHRSEKITYASLILIFLALLPLGIAKPHTYLIHIALLILVYLFLNQEKLKYKQLVIASAVMFFLFLIFGNVFALIYGKVMGYLATGTGNSNEGLHFYSVVQTVREAGKIPFDTFANRTSGSVYGVIIALIGYVVLVIRRPAFIVALPLIGIGIFSLWGGLRFTVYAVPIAAMSAVYLFWVLAENLIKGKFAQYSFVIVGTALMIYPNITHIIAYRVPTVLNKPEVQDLVALDKISSDKDYTLSWWDYGYPIWFYSNTSTLIDGGKHNNDNYIVSKIMQTPSQELAANLSRLAIETYVDSNYSIVSNTLFKDKKPKVLLRELSSRSYTPPPKTRDVFLYLPYKMMRIYPTVAVFGNINLKTGRKEHQVHFYPTSFASQQRGKVLFKNRIIYDSLKGEVILGDKKKKVYRFDTVQYRSTGGSLVNSKMHHMDGDFCIVNLTAYGMIVIMDRRTYESTYVQLFMLERYNKDLFELVVSSPYSKIYKVKR